MRKKTKGEERESNDRKRERKQRRKERKIIKKTDMERQRHTEEMEK